MLRFLTVLVLLGSAVVGWGALDLSSLQQIGPVSDYASVLTPREQMALVGLLKELDDRYGVQVGLVTLPNISGYSIGEVTESIYDQWDMGRNTVNKSALLLLSANDNQMHLYVGIGLRGVLTQAWREQLSEKISGLAERRKFSEACVLSMTEIAHRIWEKSSDIPGQGSGLAAEGNKSMSMAGLIALGFGAFLVITTFMRAGARQPSVYDTGKDFERNRTGPFGNKKPRWL